MSTIPVLCCFLVLLPLSISLGRCSNISFSICWFNNKEDLKSQMLNIWLNGTTLESIGEAGKLTSMTVCPRVKNTLSLQLGNSVYTWAFTLHQRTKHIKITGLVKPQVRPTSETQSVLQRLHSSEVFACENSTLFFHQDQDFFLAIGYTSRLPVTLESRSSSMLLLSWKTGLLSPNGTGQAHAVELYNTELNSFTPVSLETTADDHHRFTGLDSCTVYVACVEVSGTNSLICLSTLTDPDRPGDVQVWWMNSSSLALSWDCPENRRYSMFLLTVFHHQGTSYIHPQEEKVWIKEPFEWTLHDLAPCSRLSFGLQTVCVSGAETRYSRMVLHKGNSDLSNVLDLVQSSSGPEHYSLSWEVGSHSSVSKFRVLHDGKEQGITLTPNFTVKGLQPCQSHTATVQALCGEGTLMDAQTLQVHTVPRGVSGLHFVPNNEAAVWTPGTEGPDVSFMFKVFQDNERLVFWSGKVSEPYLPLSSLQREFSYRLTVWEVCDKLDKQSRRTSIDFNLRENELTEQGDRPSEIMVRAARPNTSQTQDYSDGMNEIPLIVPWTLPEDFQDQTSNPWSQMATILQDRMEKLLISYAPVHVELTSSGPAEEPGHTQYLFSVFKKKLNKTTGEADVKQPLSIRHELDNLSLNMKNLSIKDGDVHWEGPDLCQYRPCPQNSLCLNTLDAYSCLCRKDHYDVRAFMKRRAASDSPVCNDKGLFSRCLDKQLVGGISRLYLSSRLKGALQVSLNQGQCPVNQSEDFYLFKTERNNSYCGTKRKVNGSHIELQNILTVTAGEGVRRRQMRALLKCVYPRHYIRTAPVGLDLDWVSSVSVVAYNSSLQLGLSMSLFGNGSFSSSYSNTVMLGPEDTLFFQVSLHTFHSFIQDVRLQVESCWATESTNPHDETQGIILNDGCPADDTFSWLSENGASQRSRFSVQMFQMPQGLPLYFHCRAGVCGPDDNCTETCSSAQRTRRSVNLETQAVVVSAGPLVVMEGKSSRGKPSRWTEHMAVIAVVAGTIGLLFVTLMFVFASKAVMRFYQKPRLQ